MFEYQTRNRFFAQISGGMEALGAEELTALGAGDVSPAYRGIYFRADKAALYRINFASRYVTRVLAPLISFPCHSTRHLYRKAKEFPWKDLFSADRSFALFATVSNSRIRHSQYASLCLKDAIVDAFRESRQKRPDVDRLDPDIWINLHIENDQATISLDTSGGSLHRRGYRIETVEAPMQETLAAVIVALTGWDGSAPIYDPMCGSGTLLNEALMAYRRIPAGYLRKGFGFEFLPDFDEALWISVRKAAEEHIRELPEGLIGGSDVSREAVEAARVNRRRLPGGDRIELRVMDYREIDHLRDRIIVCNPPYGLRLGKGEDLGRFYGDLGDFLKRRCKGSAAYIYFGNREMISRIGLKPSWKRPFSNGGLDGRLARFEIY
jgi:putative N6-adenine-specific DNA methylase